MNLPEIFKTRMKTLLQDEYDEFARTYESKAHSGIRANTLKIRSQDLPKLLNIPLSSVPWCADGYYCPDKDFRPGKSPLYHAGLYYIQEPSAMCPASVLDIRPGQKALDLCAAPGGKSVHVAAKLAGSGILVSNDISATRCKALLKNIELSGVTNAVILNEPPEKLSERFYGYFDRILVDAPCSGEGMFRKDADAVKSWEEHKTETCVNLQRSILYHAARMLAGDGMIMYSTCTFAPEENECMIAEFLSKNPDFEIAAISHEKLGISRGRPEWSASAYALERCGRLWPHKQRGEGHFLACLHKKETDKPENTQDFQIMDFRAKANQEPQLGKKIPDIDYYYQFCDKYLSQRIMGNFELHGQSLFLLPNGLPSLHKLRVMRSGFYLGDIKTKRFEPSQAFAMGISKETAKYVINFSLSDSSLYRYLKGESFELEDKTADGWNLCCVEGYPLGWAKVSDGRLKNKYLKSWIME